MRFAQYQWSKKENALKKKIMILNWAVIDNMLQCRLGSPQSLVSVIMESYQPRECWKTPSDIELWLFHPVLTNKLTHLGSAPTSQLGAAAESQSKLPLHRLKNSRMISFLYLWVLQKKSSSGESNPILQLGKCIQSVLSWYYLPLFLRLTYWIKAKYHSNVTLLEKQMKICISFNIFR